MFTQDERARGLYESRLKAAMDERSKLHDKYQIGLQEGEELGIKKGEELGLKKGRQEGEELGRREAAIHGLKMGLDSKTLHKLTKIPVAEIEKMRREMGNHQ